MSAECGIHPESLGHMLDHHPPGTTWFGYQNKLIERGACGDWRFLLCGDGCTFQTPPKRYPDTHEGTGWRHLFVGPINLETGELPKEPERTPEHQPHPGPSVPDWWTPKD